MTAEQQVLAQYKAFWTDNLPKAFEAPAKERRGILSTVTMDPELAVLLQNMSIQDKAGERGYGADVPISQKVEIRAGVALVNGCLDSSDVGVLKVSSGKRLTRGPERNPVRVNLKVGADKRWRVSYVTYTGGGKC